MRSIGKYKLVGPVAETDFTPDQIVLDTNVLIDMRDFYFGEGRTPPELKDLLLEFPWRASRNVTDIRYGWAVAEASWVRGSGIDPVMRRRLVYAADQVLSWDTDRIIKEFSERRPPVARDKVWPRVPFEDAGDGADPRLFLLTYYGSLLYLLSLEKELRANKPKDRLGAIGQYVDWTTNQLGVRSSYPLNLACMLLAGDGASQDIVRKIFKFKDSASPEEWSEKAWNVAWDILMVSLAEGLSYGLLTPDMSRKTVLVTRDADPALLRLGAEVRLLIDTGEEIIPFTHIHSTVKVDHGEVRALVDLDPMEELRRQRRNPDDMVNQAATAVYDLETRLGVPALLSYDGWRLGG
ncbi:MAG: hypothetical protein FWD11_02030 [Micrococcales bacterium]|nr:hypothetical protein [Micrococcales bacterium]